MLGFRIQNVVVLFTLLKKRDFRHCLDLEITGFKRDEVAFVGDRIYTDVATGVKNGAKGFLVLTGEADMQTVAESEVEPDCIYDSLYEMSKYL